jgi:hypothetical protein
VLLLGALAIASLLLVTRREAASRAPAAAAGASAASRPQSRQVEPAVDPATIRDVFRFVERPSVAAPRVERPPAPSVTGASASPEPFRLVGLVRRQGRLLAAFAIDGDVVLLGPGETTGDVTVLEVGEEGVRIRRRNGAEERLALP